MSANPITPAQLKTLTSILEKWGGKIERCLEHEWMDVRSAPFEDRIGVDYQTKVLFYLDLPRRGLPDCGAFLHEAGHIFACPNQPNQAKEIDFLGWEYALGRKLGLTAKEWVLSSKDYVIANDGDMCLGDLPYLKRTEGRIQTRVKGVPTIQQFTGLSGFISERLHHARKIGIMKGMEPLSLR